MTEQLKKAAKSIHTIELNGRNDYWRLKHDLRLKEVLSCLHTSHIKYMNGSSDFSKGKGNTNWGKGDLINIKTSAQITLIEGTQPNEPELEVLTTYWSPKQKRYVELTTTEVEFFSQQTLASAVIPLDNFLCRMQNDTDFEIILKDKECDSILGYVFNFESTSTESKTIMDWVKMIVEAEYIGTEQEDGSLIYLG